MTPSGKRRGRPPRKPDSEKLTERYTVLMRPAMRDWVLDNGGGAYLRQLVRRDVEASLSVYREGAASGDEIAALERIIAAEGA